MRARLSSSLFGLCLLLLPIASAVTGQDHKEKPWWSLQPIIKPAIPPIKGEKFKNWPRNSIDNFILAKLLDKGLEPGPEAERRTLIRRVYFDLIGLPPTPEDIDAFKK